jgi:hypothetical protein
MSPTKLSLAGNNDGKIANLVLQCSLSGGVKGQYSVLIPILSAPPHSPSGVPAESSGSMFPHIQYTDKKENKIFLKNKIHSAASKIHSAASKIHSAASKIHSAASKIHSAASKIHSAASKIHSAAS